MKLALLLFAALLVLAPLGAGAQPVVTSKLGTITAQDGTVQIDGLRAGGGTVQLTGTWTGTVVVECSIAENTGTYVTVALTPAGGGAQVTSTTSNGMWSFAGNYFVCRARSTGATTGTINVSLVTSSARAPGGSGGAPINAAFVTTQAESGLTAEVSLGALTTGMLYHTVSGSVSTPASVACTSGEIGRAHV